MQTFEEANKKIHHVHEQWHYETMVAAGFVPQNLDAVGFVRTYEYHKRVDADEHIEPHVIRVTTGASRDYWEDKTNGGYGLWLDLAPHLAKVAA